MVIIRTSAVAVIIHAVSAPSIFAGSARAGVAVVKAKAATEAAVANRATARGNLNMIIPPARKTLRRLARAAAVAW
ncbi:Uncharacterised protein [Mycobacterium tuberculosis]|nr:Uncharacterised protein [Mycobacterium tuberculosis]